MKRVMTAAAAVLALATTTPAVAQQGPAEARMSFASFEPWSDETQPLRYTIVVTNTGSRPIEDPVVRTTIYRRVLSRSALHVALEGRRLRNVVAATTDDIPGPIAPGESVRYDVSHMLTQLANVFRQGIGGVYPVEITLSGSERELAEGLTAAVFVGETPKFRLNTAIVLPIHRPPSFEPETGAYTEADLVRDLGPSGFITRMAPLLVASARIPLTIAPTGLLLDQLADIADGYRLKGAAADTSKDDEYARAAAKALEELKTAAAADNGFELATTTYAWADLVPLVRSGMTSDVARQITLGRSAVAAAFGRWPSSQTFVPAGLRMDAQTAAAVSAFDVERMVLAADVVPPQTGIFGPDHPLVAQAAGSLGYPVVLSDDATAQRMTQPGEADKRLVAQGVIAEAAIAYFERPSLSDKRSFVIAPPAMPHPDIAGPVVHALSRAPWAQLRTISGLIAAVPAPEERQPLAVGDRAPARFAGAVRNAQEIIETVAHVLNAPPAVSQDLERLVLAGQSWDWVNDPARAERLVQAAERNARAILDKIYVVPRSDTPRKVTLTSRAGPLPITVQNDTGFPVSLRIRVRSAKVEFAEDTKAMEELDRRETVTFSAAARASGLSPVGVELLSCRDRPAGTAATGGEVRPAPCDAGAGGRLFGRGTVLVQSSAVSAVALAATGGGAAFLIAAWVRRGVRRRRNGGSAQPGGGQTA